MSCGYNALQRSRFSARGGGIIIRLIVVPFSDMKIPRPTLLILYACCIYERCSCVKLAENSTHVRKATTTLVTAAIRVPTVVFFTVATAVCSTNIVYHHYYYRHRCYCCTDY